MNCPVCDEEITFSDQEHERCSQCSTYVHYCGPDYKWKKVPFLDPELMKLSDWNGLGSNFLDEIRKSPTSGFLMTRKHIVWLITGSTNQSRVTGKNTWMEYWLEEYGLEFQNLTDYNKYPDGSENDYVGFIRKIGSSKSLKFPLFDFSESNIPKKKIDHFKNREIVSQISEIVQKLMKEKELRTKQREGIESVLTTPVSTIILPTGYGKTWIAQSSIISRLIAGEETNVGPTLIVYPTISLIDDQRDAWEKNLRKDIKNFNVSNPKNTLRIPKTLFLTSEYKEKNDINRYNIFAKLIDNEYDVLCCSPEFIFNRGIGTNLLDMIPQMKVPFSNIIIDEVHTFFDWGDTIRLDYLLLPIVENLIRRYNPNLHTIFMTATLHPRDEERLIELFNLDELFSPNQSIRHDELREDLAFSVIKIPNKEKLISESCRIILEQSNRIKWNNVISTSTPPFLVYSPKVKEGVKEIYRILPSGGAMYHGNTTKKKKPIISRKFMNNEITHLVCTSAFGMGVNKPDIHFTSHIDVPYTLQEIYQMFGRTARGSNWTEGEPFKNGNCIAFVSKKVQPMPYKRTAIPPKLFERLYWSIVNGKSTPGFFLFALPNDRATNSFWEPNSRKIWSKKKKDELEKKGISILDFNESRKWNDAKDLRRDRNEDFTLRSLLSLESSGIIKLRGLHPLIPVFNSGGENITLIELLEDGGYEKVIDLISLVGHDGISLNSEDRKYIVAEVIKPISSIDEIIDAFTEADLKRECFHNQSQQELVNFFKSEECVRKRFAPIIGKTSSQIISCIESYEHNSMNPLDKSLGPVVPCYICRSQTDQISSKYINDDLKYSSSDPCLWLDNKSIEILSGRDDEVNDTDEDIFGDVKNIPIEGFLIEYPLYHNNPKVDVNDIIIRKIIDEFPGIIENSTGNIHKFNYLTKNGDGEEVGNCEFEVMFGKINSPQFKIGKSSFKFTIDSGKKHFIGSFGILLYNKNNKLYIRSFSRKQAKRVYTTLRKKNGGEFINNYNCKHDFLANSPPSVGEGSNKWIEFIVL